MKETVASYFICVNDAPYYLGIDSHSFNTEAEPYLTRVLIADREGFQRKDLDT